MTRFLKRVPRLRLNARGGDADVPSRGTKPRGLPYDEGAVASAESVADEQLPALGQRSLLSSFLTGVPVIDALVLLGCISP